MVDIRGIRRRVEALQAIGWSRAEQSRLLGKERTYIRKAIARPVVQPATAVAIADLYDRLHMTIPVDEEVRSKGQNRHHELTRRRAARLGFAPPLAWDCIDTDPEPSGMRTSDTRDLLTEWAELRAAGESIDHAAHRLGVTVSAIERAEYRAKEGAA